ncbi:hypothetical protein TIFTF001_029148 [Ficus carica]|uniref:Uncharacterized protein n=1 Tax=Ficus carica TaxID=3494 RepID=A0AA88DRB0_FICCA|nr:hypothetical protein TIFTF001_029148 [Ficus carica]
MIRPRTRANQNLQESDLTNVVATLQRQLQEQQQETNQVPEVQQEIPQDAEVPIAPAGIQVNPPLVWEDLLYERFRRMKASEFEGPTDPIAADNWLIDIQVILDFIRLMK